jgi:hypothetical protein
MGLPNEGGWSWDLKWRRRLFAWEDSILADLLILLNPISFSQNTKMVGDAYLIILVFILVKEPMIGSILSVSTVNRPTLHCLNIISKCWAPLKCQIFCWSVLLDKFPFKANLRHRGVLFSQEDYLCCFCKSTIETGSHLFLDCRYSRLVWDKVLRWLGFSLSAPWEFTHILDLRVYW